MQLSRAEIHHLMKKIEAVVGHVLLENNLGYRTGSMDRSEQLLIIHFDQRLLRLSLFRNTATRSPEIKGLVLEALF